MALFRRKKTADIPAPPLAPTLPAAPEPGEDGLRSMEAQREYVLSMVEPLLPFGMALLDAIGLSLCEDISSHLELPGFDNSAMDGYAVRSADLAGATDTHPVTLPVAGVVAAGDDASEPLEPGTACKVMTGAPIPPGADAVIAYEQTDRGAEVVACHRAVAPGQHIRTRGSDITDGDLVAQRGHLLDARTIGVLAGVGVDKVLVRPRPRVVVISTGSELVEPGRALTKAGQLYDSNSHLIAAAAKATGAQVWRVGHVGDDAEALKQVINDQLIRADLIVTTGGISEGDFDIVKHVVPTLGAADFTKVRMQPGKPQGFGLIGDDLVPILMLPGNPVSSFVSFEVFVRPVIRKLMGAEPYTRDIVHAVASEAMESRPGMLQLARGAVTESTTGRTVRLVGGHSSHFLGDLPKANCLVLLAPETEHVEPGDSVEVWPLSDD